MLRLRNAYLLQTELNFLKITVKKINGPKAEKNNLPSNFKNLPIQKHRTIWCKFQQKPAPLLSETVLLRSPHQYGINLAGSEQQALYLMEGLNQRKQVFAFNLSAQ